MKRKIAGIIVSGRKLLVVKEHDLDFFMLPGGCAENDESDEACLRRELDEELGIEVVSFERIGEIDTVLEDGEPLHIELMLVTPSGEPQPSNEIVEMLTIGSDWSTTNIAVTPTIADIVIPELIRRGLLD